MLPMYWFYWYTQNPHPNVEKQVVPFSEYFGIWHQLVRSSYEGELGLFHLIVMDKFIVEVSSWFLS